MKSFLRLFMDCFYFKESFSRKTEKDERILYERNNVYYIGMYILTIFIIFIQGRRYDLFANNIDALIDFMMLFLGIVYYIMLLIFCKRGVVKHSSVLLTFCLAMFTIPSEIVNFCLTMFTDSSEIVSRVDSIVLIPVVYVSTFTILYIVADIVYLRALKKSECN